MYHRNTDREWEKFGKSDPYYGVLSDDQFRQAKLTDESREAFFRSGKEHITDMAEKIKKHLGAEFAFKRALDFGCGVGRLVIPLAQMTEHVTGVDVSESMLTEARKNCDTRGLANVTLLKGDDELSALLGEFDLIHSYIVFQHIPVARGEKIFEKLLAHLTEGGVGVVHFTYAKGSLFRKIVPWVKSYVPLATNVVNVLQGRPFFMPQMQMNSYHLDRLYRLMEQANVRLFYSEPTNHGGELGIVLYFRKESNAREQ